MRYEVSGIDVGINITDAEPVLGVSAHGLRERVVKPVRAEVTYYPDGTHRVTLRGPTVSGLGIVGTAYFEVLVSADEGNDRYPAAPQWVLDMIAKVKP